LTEHSCLTTTAGQHEELIEHARAAKRRAHEAVAEAHAAVARARDIMIATEAMRLDRAAEHRRRSPIQQP
jgi:hypothetical protein